MDDDEFSAASLAKQRTTRAEETRKAQLEATENDPELRAILMETKQVQKDTLASTQNSVRTIKETIVVADKTTVTLKQQGEQLKNIEEKAQQADINATDSYKSAQELHKYKGLLPVNVKGIFTGHKKKEEDVKLQKTQKTLDKKDVKLKHEREAAEENILAMSADKPKGNPGGADQEDDYERQIDENLDELSAGLDHLQMQATVMNSELESQKTTIHRIQAETSHTEYTLNSANRKIQTFM